MSRTDILSEIKEAESRADETVAQAESDKKAAVAQARRDSVKRIQEESAAERSAYESAMAAEQAKLAEGEKEASQIENAAKDKIKEVNDFLTKEFERAIDASS